MQPILPGKEVRRLRSLLTWVGVETGPAVAWAGSHFPSQSETPSSSGNFTSKCEIKSRHAHVPKPWHMAHDNTPVTLLLLLERPALRHTRSQRGSCVPPIRRNTLHQRRALCSSRAGPRALSRKTADRKVLGGDGKVSKSRLFAEPRPRVAQGRARVPSRSRPGAKRWDAAARRGAHFTPLISRQRHPIMLY